MDTRARSTLGQRIYDDFIPEHRLVQQGRTETLVIELQGFRKEQIKVQIDKYGKLRISGERPLIDNRWSRFHKEYQVPETYNTSAIRAKFENGLLKINLPKLATSAQDATQVTEPPLPPQDGMPRAGQEFTSQKTILRTTDEPEDTDSKQQGPKAGEQTDAQKAEEKGKGKSEDDDDRKTGTTDAGEKQQLVTAQANSGGGLNYDAGTYDSESYWRRQTLLRMSVAFLVLVGMLFYAMRKLRNAYTYRQLEE